MGYPFHHNSARAMSLCHRWPPILLFAPAFGSSQCRRLLRLELGRSVHMVGFATYMVPFLMDLFFLPATAK